MANIVYYLGAGASANALPVVGGMVHELKLLAAFFEWPEKSMSTFFLTEEEVNSIRFSCHGIKELFLESAHFDTPDTFAKYLSLTNRTEDFLLFKKAISYYFLLRQLDKDVFNEFNSIYGYTMYFLEEQKLNFDIKSKKMQNSETRYDSFLASILDFKNSQIDFPKNLKILSWNYDSQFEFSINKFVSKKTLLNNSNIYLDILKNQTKESYGFPILQLNGTAKIKNTQFLERIVTNSLFRKEKLLLGKEWENFSSEGIKFAWESSEAAYRSVVKQAKDIITKAQVLIIIGYSFPVFNREVDFEVLRKFEGYKVYLQTRPESMKETRNRMVAMTQWGKAGSKVEIEEIDTTDQFYIPFEFHRKEINLFE